MKNAGLFFVSAFIAVSLAPVARATSLVTNGDFEVLTNGPGQMGYNTDAIGWTTSGYNFIFAPGTADNGGSTGQYAPLQLWGPNNGSSNGLPATSPVGGNFLGADGAFQVGAITQTINRLTVGDQYALSFYWAGAQQFSFDSPTTEQWQVSLGDETQSTNVVNNVGHGFTGWVQQTLIFAATSGSELLSFLAIGTPDGQPPFSLLDGVTMQDVSPTQDVPEPATWTMMLGGILVLGIVVRRHR